MPLHLTLPNVSPDTLVFHAATIAAKRNQVAAAKRAVSEAVEAAGRAGIDGHALHDLLKLTPARVEQDEDKRLTRAAYATALQIPWLHATPPALIDIMQPEPPEQRAETARRSGFWDRVNGHPAQPPYDDDRAALWLEGWHDADGAIMREILRSPETRTTVATPD